MLDAQRSQCSQNNRTMPTISSLTSFSTVSKSLQSLSLSRLYARRPTQ